MILATWVTRQLVFNGVVDGLVFGLVALGIVLVYRSTRVINFAVTNLGMLGAGLFALLAVQYDVPFWLSAGMALAVGTVYGAVIELVVVRRLFDAPRVIVLVATIAVAQLSLLWLIMLPEIDEPGARFPVPIGSVRRWADVRVTGPQLTICLVVPMLALALGWLLNRTALGRAVKASADNPDLARLDGISPKLVSTAVWATAGALATLSLSLLAGQTSSVENIQNLGPSTLVRALAAAVIAKMVSFPRAMVAGIAIGVAQSLIAFNYDNQAGLIDFVIFVIVLAVIYRQSRGGVQETQTFSFAVKGRPLPERLRSVWWLRQLDRAGLAALLVGAVVLPLVVTQASKHLLYTNIVAFAVCAVSLTILTGWAGQLSLSQMAFAGIGAMLLAGFERGLNVDIGWRENRFLKAGIEPLPFELALVAAVVATAGVAALVGLSSLRIRGLYLAITTFAFGLAATQYLYRRPILDGGFRDSVPYRRSDVFGIDLTTQRSAYYMSLVLLVLVVAVIGRLRRSGIGRTTIAVRDNPDTAAAYTVSAARTKLRAFALTGGVAALGGCLIAVNLQTVPTAERFFTVPESLNLVAMVVIGGMGSVAGPVLGAVWVVGLPKFFPDNDFVPLLTSSIGLLVLLLYFPGGLVQIGYTAREAIVGWVERRTEPAPPKQTQAVPVPVRAANRQPAPAGAMALAVRDVTVRFGGIVAVDHVNIEVRTDEIVGLIGTNGAGKSTLMNAIGGFVASDGDVAMLGDRISSLSAGARASRGLGRTFQAAALFPELTVRETVLVALESRHRTGLVSTAAFWPGSFRVERSRRAEGAEIIDFLGLGRYADTYISDLSTGTRRIVELAGLLALDARVLCLDEPTAGLAQRETEAFGPLVLAIRRELGAAMLMIEHDMPLIMSVSDRVYCLEAGTVIAEGDPATVRNDPAVIASYLGTDERAIARSGAAAGHSAP